VAKVDVTYPLYIFPNYILLAGALELDPTTLNEKSVQKYLNMGNSFVIFAVH